MRVLPSPVLWGIATLAVVRCQVTALRLRCGDASVGLNRGGSLVVEAAHLIVRHERREYSGSAADERKRP